MTQIVDTESFDPSAALALLDGIAWRGHAAIESTVESAWEAAWIACLTNSASWADVSAAEFDRVVTELRGVIWTSAAHRADHGSFDRGDTRRCTPH